MTRPRDGEGRFEPQSEIGGFVLQLEGGGQIAGRVSRDNEGLRWSASELSGVRGEGEAALGVSLFLGWSEREQGECDLGGGFTIRPEDGPGEPGGGLQLDIQPVGLTRFDGGLGLVSFKTFAEEEEVIIAGEEPEPGDSVLGGGGDLVVRLTGESDRSSTAGLAVSLVADSDLQHAAAAGSKRQVAIGFAGLDLGRNAVTNPIRQLVCAKSGPEVVLAGAQVGEVKDAVGASG